MVPDLWKKKIRESLLKVVDFGAEDLTHGEGIYFQ